MMGEASPRSVIAQFDFCINSTEINKIKSLINRMLSFESNASTTVHNVQ